MNPQGRRMGQFVVSVDPKGSLAFSGPVLALEGGRPAAHVIQAVTEQVWTRPTWPTCGRWGCPTSSPERSSWTAPCCWEKLAARFGVPRPDGGRRRGGELVLASKLDAWTR